jgi:CRISPR-associated protein Cmr1
MQPFRITLETITPLFLGGADARGAPELRPPAFRGALRYWLRALAGAALGTDEQSVREFEAQVFGSPDEDSGGASGVSLRLVPKAVKPPVDYDRNAMGPTSPVTKYDRAVRQPSGRNYFYWSMTSSGRQERGNFLPARKYFPEGSTFDLVLTRRPGAQDSAFNAAVAALWLLIQFGGVGSRSRRTAGSLGVVGKPEYLGLRFYLSGETPQAIAEELRQGIQTCLQLPGLPAAALPPFPGFDVLSLDHKVNSIWVLGAKWTSWAQAVDEVGGAMCTFRTYSPPDHDNVIRWINGASISTVERSVFGLPIPYRYSSGPQGVIQGRPENKARQESEINRRASPLWLKISKTTGGKYAAIATLFKSEFLPSGEKLHLAKSSSPAVTPPKDYALIETWLRKSFKDIQEVTR